MLNSRQHHRRRPVEDRRRRRQQQLNNQLTLELHQQRLAVLKNY
jgi:hypothetical protein